MRRWREAMQQSRGGEEVRGDFAEEEVLPSTEGTRKATRELQAQVAGHWLQAEM